MYRFSGSQDRVRSADGGEKGTDAPTMHANGHSMHANVHSMLANGHSMHADDHSMHANGRPMHADEHSMHANGHPMHADEHSMHANGHSMHADDHSMLSNGRWMHANGQWMHANGRWVHANGPWMLANGDSAGSAEPPMQANRRSYTPTPSITVVISFGLRPKEKPPVWWRVVRDRPSRTRSSCGERARWRRSSRAPQLAPRVGASRPPIPRVSSSWRTVPEATVVPATPSSRSGLPTPTPRGAAGRRTVRARNQRNATNEEILE